MNKDDRMPSESEWQIMEVMWAQGGTMTSAQVIDALRNRGGEPMSDKMVRVLMNRLCTRGLLDHTQDEKDARVYHYRVLASRKDCEKEKSKSFIKNYFSGRGNGAVAALLQTTDLTSEEIDELEKLLEKKRKKEV